MIKLRIILPSKTTTEGLLGGPITKTLHSQCKWPRVQIWGQELDFTWCLQDPGCATKVKDPRAATKTWSTKEIKQVLKKKTYTDSKILSKNKRLSPQ